jgi:hypothetical protein
VIVRISNEIKEDTNAWKNSKKILKSEWNKEGSADRHWWLMSIILGIWKAEIGRTVVPDQPR